MWNPDAGKHGSVNLSTVATPSSSGVLASVRAQRQARELQRRHELAAVTIQRVWRGRESARATRARLLEHLEALPVVGVLDTGKVMVLLGGEGDRDRIGGVVERWAASALEKDGESALWQSRMLAHACACRAELTTAAGQPAFARGLADDDFAVTLALVLRRALRFIAKAPGYVGGRGVS